MLCYKSKNVVILWSTGYGESPLLIRHSSVQELQRAKRALFRFVQNRAYSQEVQNLQNPSANAIMKSSEIYKLNPVLIGYWNVGLEAVTSCDHDSTTVCDRVIRFIKNCVIIVILRSCNIVRYSPSKSKQGGALLNLLGPGIPRMRYACLVNTNVKQQKRYKQPER